MDVLNTFISILGYHFNGCSNLLFFLVVGNIGKVVEKRAMEVSNFLDMLRSASTKDQKAVKNKLYNEWKVILSHLHKNCFSYLICTKWFLL